VQSRSELREIVFGPWLVVAMTLTLVVAAALAGMGLYFELSGARVTIVAARQPALVAGQMTAEASVPAEADDHDADGDDGDALADPHTHPTGTAAAIAGGTPSPTATAEVAAAPSPSASPETIAEASPSPQTVARKTPDFGPPGAPRATADVPIVMYHHVGLLPPNPDAIRRDLTVSPELFERTLEQLQEKGIGTVTMAELFDHFTGGPALPQRCAILTFDDGYDDNYEFAFQMLKQRGMVGTFFISTDFVERPGYLTWDQIKEMADAGMEIAAHSANHPDFRKLGPAELRRQLVEPKAQLEEATGKPVRFMAYPAGMYNPAVMAATRAAGYEAAVTVLHGTRHTPSLAFELRRVRARGADTAGEIVTRMTAASWRQ
jgi:peptidoglycan/xylan/chitin deacetylase (PgdA/CDA1 family)